MTSMESIKPGLVDEDEFNESLSRIDVGGHDPDAGSTVGATLGDTSIAAGGQPAWVGKTMGHFKLLGQIGQGAMGLVIRAQDVNLGRIVALKVLRKRIKGMDDQQRVNQFLREARASARIEHPNVAHIYEINEHHGWWYLATELIEGGTLQDAVKAAGRLSPAQACPLLADAASALAVAHQLGIVHRDVKPRNLMLTRAGRCKVVDFGLVRVDDPNDPFDFTSHAVGTPLYLPPEAIRRQTARGSLDVYALAATLFYALTGSPPFRSRDLKELIRLHTEAVRPDVREKNPDCSESLAALIQRAMAIDPESRPSAADLAAALRLECVGAPAAPGAGDGSGAALMAQIRALRTDLADAAEGSGILTRARGASLLAGAREQSGRRPLRATTVAVALLVLIAAGAFVLLRQKGIVGVQPIASREAFAHAFPDAPLSYGAPARDGAGPDLAAPPFSWRGRVDPGSATLVASEYGRYAFSVSDPRSFLIPADAAVFFASEETARQAGKTTMPR